MPVNFSPYFKEVIGDFCDFIIELLYLVHMSPPAVTSTLSYFPCQVKQRAISKQHLTGNALLFKSRPEFLSLLHEEAVVHCRLNAVFLVCPVSIMIVQPVDEHIILLVL